MRDKLDPNLVRGELAGQDDLDAVRHSERGQLRAEPFVSPREARVTEYTKFIDQRSRAARTRTSGLQRAAQRGAVQDGVNSFLRYLGVFGIAKRD